MGGAIFNDQGTLTMINTTLASNLAAGGPGGSGGDPAATAGEGLGGALFNLGGTVTISSSTLASNNASTDGGALYNLAYNSAVNFPASLSLQNTIAFGSGDGAGHAISDLLAAQPANVAPAGEGGANKSVASTDASEQDIVGRPGTSGLTSIAGSPSSSDPRLGPLAANGGPGMATMALSPGSPALKVGSGCPMVDERGVPRPAGLCDLGAYQLSVEPGPGLSRLAVTPTQFSLAGRKVKGRCVKPRNGNTTTARRCTRPIRLRVSYTLNGASTITFIVRRVLPGRKVNGVCVRRTVKSRSQRCQLVVTLNGSLTRHGKPGANSFTFTGKVGGRTLGPGAYQLAAMAPPGMSLSVSFKLLP
jgi:hypothetical protein